MTLHKGENPYIYGLHDPGGEHLMIVAGEAKGWVLVTEAIGSEANERGGGDYRGISDQGVGVIVRLNQSYGPNGTIPREKRYPEFSQRVANFVQASKGAHIWLIGNEMNFEREQPRREGSNEPEPITPRRYARCYKMCRAKVKALPGRKDDLVVVGAPAPWNAQTKYEADPKGQYPANPNGDWIQYFRDILVAIGPGECDAFAIHAYSHGYSPELVFSEATMDPPFQNRYFNFFTYRDHMNAVPEDMRHLPVYLTEMNGDREGGHNGPTWPFGNNGWIKNAYKEIDNWNQRGEQQIRCGILFRWQKDPLGWSIDGKPEVQQDFREAIAKNYKWDPEAPVKAKPERERISTRVTTGEGEKRPNYLARYLGHNTPETLAAGQTVEVMLALQNAGSFEWQAGGDKPFRLGFQWFDSNGQYISFPPELDFRTPLPQNVPPDGQVRLRARLRTPDRPGSYQMRWDMVHEKVTWFSSQGDDPGLVVPITVTRAEEKAPPKTTGPATPVTIDAEDVTNSLTQHPTKSYPMRTHTDIERIIIHHTATPPNVSVQRIADFQVKNRDLPGITYHYCITAEGKVFQGQYLETASAHAGSHSSNSVGVCLIGNFTSAPPPEPQLAAAATLLAQLATHLGLSPAQIVGYSELVTTGSPGATWPSWKPDLLNRVRQLMSGDEPISQPRPREGAAPTKSIEHYMLFWYRNPESWAEWDLQGAFDYIARFKPAIGFDIEQAKAAQYVTIVGGSGGVPPNAERILRAAGCQVERIDGETETGTRRLLQELAARGQRFRTLK